MNKRSTKWYRKNEAELMKRLGLKPTINSGAVWFSKGDGESDNFLCELKSTDHESFTIKQQVLHQLEYQALEAHKMPLFVFQFLNLDEVWLSLRESDIGAYKELVRGQVLDELLEELEFLKVDLEHGNTYQNSDEKINEILCKFNEITIVLKKELDKGIDKSYNKGEKRRGGFEVFDFMPTHSTQNTNTDTVVKQHNTQTVKTHNSLNVEHMNVDNTQQLLNNTDVIGFDVPSGSIKYNNNTNNIDNCSSVNINKYKLKQNINARSNYIKQKEKEKVRLEEQYKQKRRIKRNGKTV